MQIIEMEMVIWKKKIWREKFRFFFQVFGVRNVQHIF